MSATDAIDAPPAIRNRLRRLGLERPEDLILHLPLRYEDETRITTIAEAAAGGALLVEGQVLDLAVGAAPRRQLVVRVADGSGGVLALRFIRFHASQQRGLEAASATGRRLRIFGEIRHGFHGPEMVHPRYRIVAADEPLAQTLTPVYPTTAGLGQGTLRRLIARALAGADLTELLDADWCLAQALPSFAEAVALLHAPPSTVPESTLQDRSHPAWRRIKFDELLAQQLSLRRAYLARRRRPGCWQGSLSARCPSL